ncbi:hypothetical protein JCM10213_003404 [Rhodosporidiobolus nylandii]
MGSSRTVASRTRVPRCAASSSSLSLLALIVLISLHAPHRVYASTPAPNAPKSFPCPSCSLLPPFAAHDDLSAHFSLFHQGEQPPEEPQPPPPVLVRQPVDSPASASASPAASRSSASVSPSPYLGERPLSDSPEPQGGPLAAFALPPLPQPNANAVYALPPSLRFQKAAQASPQIVYTPYAFSPLVGPSSSSTLALPHLPSAPDPRPQPPPNLYAPPLSLSTSEPTLRVRPETGRPSTARRSFTLPSPSHAVPFPSSTLLYLNSVYPAPPSHDASVQTDLRAAQVPQYPAAPAAGAGREAVDEQAALEAFLDFRDIDVEQRGDGEAVKMDEG